MKKLLIALIVLVASIPCFSQEIRWLKGVDPVTLFPKIHKDTVHNLYFISPLAHIVDTIGIADGDNGDITTTGSGSIWTIDNSAVTNAKIFDVAWSKVTGTPTTISAYGITDAVTLTGTQTVTNKTLTAPKLESSSTVGYVWTATGTSGQGGWAAGGSGSQWTTTGNDIYYNTGKVGINTTTPTSLLHIVNSSLATTQNDTTGIYLANHTNAGAGATNKISPALIFKGSDYYLSTVRDIRFQIYSSETTLGSPELLTRLSVNGGSSYSTILKVDNGGVVGSRIITSDGSVFGGQTTITDRLTIPGTTMYGYQTVFSGNDYDYSQTRISVTGGVVADAGTVTSNYFGITGAYNMTAGTGHTIRGFYYNPTLTAITNTKHYAFWNTTGDNLFGTTSGSVGIGANTTVAASAILDITSTTKGVLLPRMTKTQRDAISSPATGLMIFQTDNTPGLRVYNGTNWMAYTETID